MKRALPASITTIRDIDDVINLMYELNTNLNLGEVQDYFRGPVIYKDTEDLKRIMDKLCREYYMDYHEDIYGPDGLEASNKLTGWSDKQYYITFDGKILKDAGGYKQKLKNDRIILRKTALLNILLMFGGVAAGVYYIVELLSKYVLPFFACN